MTILITHLIQHQVEDLKRKEKSGYVAQTLCTKKNNSSQNTTDVMNNTCK